MCREKRHKHVWTSQKHEWCEDEGLNAVFFFDKCLSLSEVVESELLAAGKKVLYASKNYAGSDAKLISSIIKFVKNNAILTKNKVKLFLVTNDDDIEYSSKSKDKLDKANLDIKIVHFKIRKGERLHQSSPRLRDVLLSLVNP